MPDLKELLKEREVKKFTKKTYRPWDLSGNGSSLDIDNPFDPALTSKPLSIIHKPSISEQETTVTLESEHIASQVVIDNIIDNKKVTNKYQPDTELGNNEKAIEYPIDNTQDNNRHTKGCQLDNIIDNADISNKLDISDEFVLKKKQFDEKTEGGATVNKSQTIDIIQSNLEQEILRLSGKQKIIFDIIIEICTTRQSLDTGPVKTGSLAAVAQTSIGTTKTTIKRLIDKNLIIRNQGKNAKGGYINLGTTNEILEHVANIKQNNKSNIFASDILLANRYQIDISQDIYSSSNSNNITTNFTKKIESMPSEWENINYDPLAHIGFSKTQLKQMIGKNEPSVVQESIFHFAYGLDHNQKFKKYEDPLNVLMGVLRKGQGWVESDYRSASEIAQLKFLESKKAEIARKKSLEEEAFKLALSEWEEQISHNERAKITEKKNGDLTPSGAKLSKHFRENVWPTVRGEYIL